MGGDRAADWVVLVPVKELGAAKTRLDVPRRDRVALAMSVDTVDAAASASLVREVMVITDDPRALAALRAPRQAAPRLPGCACSPTRPAPV